MTAPKAKPPVEETPKQAPKKGKSTYTLEYEKAVADLAAAKQKLGITTSNKAIKELIPLIKMVEYLDDFNNYREALTASQKK